MAKNKEAGDDRRVGAVRKRSQITNKLTGTWTKRDDKSGKFLDVKADAKPFKGVRKKPGKAAAAKKPAAKKALAKKAVKRVVKKAPARKAAKRR
ncbi:MAG: hypothetical protein AB7S70_16320 [Hyphomicrobium sp.]|uniref:hypothetical protein n=1 Tax=Hyphomicrobium sp. TaxID=82 RepID=UPI003D0F69FA